MILLPSGVINDDDDIYILWKISHNLSLNLR